MAKRIRSDRRLLGVARTFRTRLSGRVRRDIAAAQRRLFDSRPYAMATRRTHALVLGDSHVEVFRGQVHVRGVRWAVQLVGGATALGMVNPNSKTDALRIFDERLNDAPLWQPSLFMLGEIDCGFVIFYRAEKHGTPIEEQLEESVGNYLAFLERHAARRRIVLSAPLPTIRDGQTFGEVADARREVKATLRERTAITLRYNTRLEQRCHEAGIEFVDVTAPQFDPATGAIRENLRRPDPTDHHLHPQRYAAILERELEKSLR